MRRAGRLRGIELFAYKQQKRLAFSRSVGAGARAGKICFRPGGQHRLSCRECPHEETRPARSPTMARLREAQPACLYSIGWMGERCARVHSSRRTPLNSANLPSTMNSPYVQD